MWVRIKPKVWYEQWEERCGEGTLLAKGDGGGGAKRNVDSRVLRNSRLRESQFYWWRRELKARREKQTRRGPGGHGALPALVPVSNKSEFRALPEETAEKLDVVFYGDVDRAVLKAIEL